MTPIIRCAICDTPVKRIQWWDDHLTDERVVRVDCHGDTDEMRIGHAALIAMNKEPEFREGVAFTTKRIEK